MVLAHENVHRRRLKTGKTNLSDLERALGKRDNAPEGLRQMTLRGLYDLARKGDSLTLRELDRFDGRAVGSGFMIMRYDIKGGCVLTVHCDTPDSVSNYARLSKRGCDPFDEALTVDPNEHFPNAFFAKVFAPFHSLDPHAPTGWGHHQKNEATPSYCMRLRACRRPETERMQYEGGQSGSCIFMIEVQRLTGGLPLGLPSTSAISWLSLRGLHSMQAG